MQAWSRRLLPVLALVVAVGCTPAAPTPSPLPSFRCTPEAGGAEFDCSQAQYDEMVAKDALYAEAEAVYRKFLAEDERIFRQGGVSEPTPTLLDTATGAFLEDSMELYRTLKTEDRRLVGGEMKLVSLVRAPGITKEASLVSLRSCVDARSASVVVKGKNAGHGYQVEDLLYFGRVGGGLKILGADGKGDSECAGS